MNKTMMLLALYIPMLLLTAGCATDPTPLSEARPPPSERIYYQAVVSKNSTATAVFIRDKGYPSPTSYNQIRINEKLAASLEEGESFTVRLPPGDYLFSVASSSVLLGTSTPYPIDQTLVAGKTYYYRILFDQNYGTRIQRTLAPAP